MNGGSLRELERESIEAFLRSYAPVFSGRRVLDYGCGRQPYRRLIEEAGGDYFGYDSSLFRGALDGGYDGGEDAYYHDWPVVVCTQVIQYVYEPIGLLADIRDLLLSDDGVLLMTGPTNWPEVEEEDLHRFTRAGIRRLLKSVGFAPVTVEARATVPIPGFNLSLGWKAVARR